MGPEALIAALPQPAALLDAQGRLIAANGGLRARIGGAVLLRAGDDAALLMPEASGAIAAIRGGEAEALAASALGRFRALRAAEGVLLLLEPPEETSRLEMLGRLAGGVAHDFNNLLGAVLGAAAALRGIPAAEEEVDIIESAALRGRDLVRQLLAFARQQVMAPRSIDLNASIRALAPLLARLLGNGVRIELALEEPSRRIRVDPGQWDQVLMNLAVNARDAMGGQGRLRFVTGRRLVLEGATPRPGRYALVEVTDEGPGIPPEILPRIFEPFVSSRIEKGGTGLGLATVQGIVGQSGGHIEVESLPGQGATFRILMPRDEGPEEAPRPAPTPAMGFGTVLLVDDEPALLRVAGLGLKQAGIPVETAADGEEALERIEAGFRPALLATDVALPGMDGLALARAARAVMPGLPVLLLSGYAASTVGADLAAENLAFASKPYTPAELRAAVLAAMGGA
ncbi:ATP-binding protein [Roseococcus sp. YIM B11640]|uniref:ATP-binding protein n=1 Tax=Roseococcus sp. YIM B11640 TaxID=3133973 RepID=UPI003C79CACE